MTSRRTVFLFLSFAAIAVLLAGGTIYYAVFTPQGSNFIIRTLISQYVKTENTSVKKTTGNFSETLVYQDIEFRDLKWLPQGNLLKIQRLEITLDSFSLGGLSVKIRNGKLNLSGSDGILFYGDYHKGIFDITVYSKGIGVRDVLDFFFDIAALKKISGMLGDVDINVRGSFFEPEIYGNFHVQELSVNNFSMTNCPCEMEARFKDIKDAFKLNGQIVLKGGRISGPKTAVINLKESRILFVEDNPKLVMFDLKGIAAVEKVKINIVLKGTFDQPELNLTSIPPMEQDRLLFMLITNKTWQSVETAINKQSLSPDIAKDFLDYFVFSGTGSKLAEKYGLRDISLKYDGTVAGIGASKDITNKIAVSYSVEQMQKKTKDATINHRIGGEYKITEEMSVSAEKGLKQNGKTAQAEDKQQVDDKVTVKFKKEF
ncbi:MAG: translocation/assembly module TamB domain-containing protein [Candidatus Omnitrophota bacterium]